VREAVFGSEAWFILPLWTMQCFCMGCDFMKFIQGKIVRKENGKAVCKERMAKLSAKREWQGVCDNAVNFGLVVRLCIIG